MQHLAEGAVLCVRYSQAADSTRLPVWTGADGAGELASIRAVKDLVDAARANPGKLTFGHAGIGSQTHLAAENFVWQAKIDALAVPYKGEGPGLAGLVGGETQFFVGNLAASIGHIQGGRLRALGVTSKTETPQLPGVPPIANTVPGFENHGLVRPGGADRHAERDRAEGLPRHEEGARGDATCAARLYVQGLAPVGNTPEEMGARDEGGNRALGARGAGNARSASSESRSAPGRGGGEGALHPRAEDPAAGHQAGLRRAREARDRRRARSACSAP